MDSPQRPDVSPPARESTTGPRRYTVGSLIYDRRGLAVLFGWLLWGDFAFNFFEQIFGRFAPLYLKDLHASNTLIGIMTGSIAGVVNLLFLPNISHWSDRLRGRLGRRIPLLLIATPLTAISVILIGFGPEIGAWLHRNFTASAFPSLSKEALVLSLLCALTVAYHFFNMILVNAFNWLVHDVVPSVLMARFLSWFRIIGTLSAFLFLWYVFPAMFSHRQITFLLIGIFYLVAFSLMCWGVKEGKNEEAPRPDHHFSTLKVYGAYFRDCLRLPIYRNYFLSQVLMVIGWVSSGTFLTLFSRNTLGLSMEDIGQIGAYATLFGAFVYVPMGWVCDKFNDFRVLLISSFINLSVPLLSFLFVHDRQSLLIITLLGTIPGVASGLAGASLTMHIFPEKSFGQFSAGLNVFGCGGWLVGNYLIGVFMDLTKSNYRLAFLWQFVFGLAALIPLLFVYRSWKQFGGVENYTPPDPTVD